VRPRSGRGASAGTEPSGAAGEAAVRRGSPAADHEAQDPESVARGTVLDALSRAVRTRAQLEATLARKGIAPEVGERVLDRFEEVGLVDDAGYAQAFVESRHEVRGQGKRALAYELRRRGVADEAVEDALETLDEEREFETACRLAQNRARRLEGLAPEVRSRRLAGFLARKGYSGDTVSRAVRRALDEADVRIDDDQVYG
jgi:regulatory protein